MTLHFQPFHTNLCCLIILEHGSSLEHGGLSRGYTFSENCHSLLSSLLLQLAPQPNDIICSTPISMLGFLSGLSLPRFCTCVSWALYIHKFRCPAVSRGHCFFAFIYCLGFYTFSKPSLQQQLLRLAKMDC